MGSAAAKSDHFIGKQVSECTGSHAAYDFAPKLAKKKRVPDTWSTMVKRLIEWRYETDSYTLCSSTNASQNGRFTQNWHIPKALWSPRHPTSLTVFQTDCLLLSQAFSYRQQSHLHSSTFPTDENIWCHLPQSKSSTRLRQNQVAF